MADLYSVILGIEPDQQDILEAELLARQILEAQYPDLDLREGTGVRDLVLRPSAFILAIAKKAFDFYFTQNTLAGVTDDTPTEIVDGILGNLFLTRNTGTYSVINARLYFARQKSVSIPTSTSFSTDGSLIYYPSQLIPITDTAMSYDSSQNEWYYDVDLVASATGSAYNLSSGSLLYFTNFDPFFLHAEINYLAQASTDSETNTQFIARAGSAISTRNLVNVPSIDSVLRQTFNYIDKLLVIGSGTDQRYMHRDQVFVNGPRGTVRVASGAAFASSGTRIRLTLTSHGYIVGQLLDITESGSGTWVFKSTPVVNVVDANTFEILIGFTYGSHTLGTFSIVPVEPDLWLHQGGAVDVYVGDTTLVNEQQLTLNSSGKVSVFGPIYKTTRINGLTDTVVTGASFTVSSPGWTSRADVSISQNGTTGVITVTMPAHCMTVGRMLKITNWPVTGSDIYLPVSSLIDGDTFTVGTNNDIYAVMAGTLSITYVQPDGDTGFTADQRLVIDFGSGHANQTVTFDLYKFDKVESVQSYLSADTNRIVCGNFQARGFDIYVLTVNVTFYTTPLPSSAEISDVIEPVITGIQPGEAFLVSDIVDAIVKAGYTGLKLPVSVNYKLYTKDLFPVQAASTTDHITPISQTCVYLLNTVSVTGDTL